MTNASLQPGLSFAPGAAGAPTPAPIHDIVGPVPFLTGMFPEILAAALLAAVAGALIWHFLLRKKAPVPTPREAALGALLRLRERVSEGSDHDFGVGVSDVLRRFLGEALGLAAPRQTTEEFLLSLRGSLRFLPAEQEALAAFLHRADFLKYARGEATPEQRISLIEAAASFVRSGESPAQTREGNQEQEPPGDRAAHRSGKEPA